MAGIIAPSITAETAEAYKAAVERLQPFATRVHVDISDGEFAPNFLLGEESLYWPENWQVDIHAMVMRPSEHLARLIALKPNLIILHAEAVDDLQLAIAQIKQAGIKAGIALLKTTVPATVRGLIEQADHVMIFSGDLGKYGGEASLMQLEKVRMVKAMKPNAEIGWDGGANMENAYTLSHGGVDVLNIGSAIAESDNPQHMFDALTKEINKTGVI